MDARVIDTTDGDRYPTLTADGQAMLKRLREHGAAPIFRNESGNRLLAEEVEQVRAFEREIASAQIQSGPGLIPSWVDEFVADAWERVPYFRALGPRPRTFYDLPTTSRAELGKDCARFVPDDVPIERLINFQTSGTSGHPILIPSHPVVAASYLAFHKRALGRFGIELAHGRGQVGVILLGFQRKCFTYVSVTPTMDESGLAKINLHPDDWRHPDDRGRYLETMAPEVIAGDPLSFAELLTLECELRPRAILSTSMMLLPGMRRRLEARFQCVVVDLYSMNEAGPIAVFDPKESGHVLLQPRMHVEILVGEIPAKGGERGEITITGGFNFCLPLIRYRTGDFASLDFTACGEPVLVGLQGRPAVRFRSASGRWLNNIEVTHALKEFALPQFTLHQFADGRFRFRSALGTDPGLRTALENLLGSETPLDIEFDVRFEDKVIQYTTDLADALP
jgi:phenylacetate-CoA ligase